MVLIDKAALLNKIAKEVHYDSEHSLEMYAKMLSLINDAPTVDAEPTEEQVKEYCYKRCLVIVTSELFNEMKARWSAEPVRHGRWQRERNPMRYQVVPYVFVCDQCGTAFEYDTPYCGECGAKMDEVKDG